MVWPPNAFNYCNEPFKLVQEQEQTLAVSLGRFLAIVEQITGAFEVEQGLKGEIVLTKLIAFSASIGIDFGHYYN